MRRALLKALFAAAVLCVGPSVQSSQTPADAVIARVNGEPLTLSEVKEVALEQDVPVNSLLSHGLEGEGFRRALTQLVDERLLVQQARQTSITPREQDIARRVELMIQGLRERMGSDEKMNDFLRSHFMSLDSLRRVFTERERRRDMLSELVARRVQIDEAKLSAFTTERRSKGEMLNEVQLAQILVLCTPDQRRSAEGREVYLRALQIARQATARPDQFEKFAREKSEDPSGRISGGYLGWLDLESLQPEIREKVTALKPGDISDPITTDQGFHIVRLLGTNGPRDLLFQQEFEKERIALVEELRARAMIQFYDFEGRPIRDTGARLGSPAVDADPLIQAEPAESKPNPAAEPTATPAFAPAQPGAL